MLILPPFLKDSVAAPLLSAYYPDCVGMSPSCTSTNRGPGEASPEKVEQCKAVPGVFGKKCPLGQHALLHFPSFIPLYRLYAPRPGIYSFLISALYNSYLSSKLASDALCYRKSIMIPLVLLHWKLLCIDLYFVLRFLGVYCFSPQ